MPKLWYNGGMLSEHKEQLESEGEGLSLYFSHRLGMLSFPGIIVSLAGLLYFSFAKSKIFFGTPIGIFECAVLFLVSVVVFVLVGLDYKFREEEKKNREFYGFAVEIDNCRKSLKNCADDVAEFQALRDNLVTFTAIMFIKHKIECPPIPMSFHASEWKESKEKWRIFLDNLYVGAQAKSMPATRELLEELPDIFPNINVKNEKEEIAT